MSAIKLVVFDIAGTTVRDNGNVAQAFLAAFRDFGFTIPPSEVKKVMGFRKIDAIALLLGKFAPEKKDDESLIDRIHTRFIDTMIAYYRDDSALAPMPHAEQLFASLQERGVKIALNRWASVTGLCPRNKRSGPLTKNRCLRAPTGRVQQRSAKRLSTKLKAGGSIQCSQSSRAR